MMNTPLPDWCADNQPGEQMLWKQAAILQFQLFMQLGPILKTDVKVISTHTSKSIELPVVELTTPEGVRFTIRENFFDYKVSVLSPIPIEEDFGEMFDPEREINSVYFEGFPGRDNWSGEPDDDTSRVFGSMRADPKRFSVELHGEEAFVKFVTQVAAFVRRSANA